MKKVWNWIKKNIIWIASGLVAVIVSICYIILRKNSEEVFIARKEAKIARVQAEIANLNTEKRIIEEKEGFITSEVIKINNKIEKLDNKLNIEKEKIKSMKPEEVLKEFENMGY